MLLVLIQQNCVAPLRGETPDSDTLYHIHVDNILHRLRYPRFLLHTRECMGEMHEALVEGLLEHGRLRARALFERAEASSSGVANRATGASRKDANDALSTRGTRAEKAFEELVEGRFVERVPVGFGEHLGRADEDEDMDGEEDDGPSDGSPPPNRAAAAKRRKKSASGVLDVSARGDGGGFGAEDHLWRVNADEFNRRFRHVACAALVREKVDDAAGHLLLAMLELSRAHEAKVNEERSTPVSEAEIVRGALAKNAEFGVDRAKTTLQKMANDTSELISCVGDAHGGPNYCVNMRRIIDLIRMKEIEAVVRERFGGPACRIFRLLIMKRNLEQKQIAEMAMIPVKDTRELLYKLLKAEYVQIQEVARTSDHAPSRTFYLWRVDLLRVVEQVGRELYRATSNLRARLIHELSQERETLQLLERAQDTSTVPLTTGQRQNLVRMRTVATSLESSLLRLDELVCFFAVF
mgnify:FL=1